MNNQSALKRLSLDEEEKTNTINSDNNDENDENCCSDSASRHPAVSIALASSRAESLMISSSGDVIVCRCRDSVYPLRGASTDLRISPMNKSKAGNENLHRKRNFGWNGYIWMREIASICCDGDLNQTYDASDYKHAIHHNSTNIDRVHTNQLTHGRNATSSGGLLGGAQPATLEATSPFLPQQQQSSSTSLQSNYHQLQQRRSENSYHGSHLNHLIEGSDSTTISSRARTADHNHIVFAKSIVNDYDESVNMTNPYKGRPSGCKSEAYRDAAASPPLNSDVLSAPELNVVVNDDNVANTFDDEGESAFDDCSSNILPIQSFDLSSFYEDSNAVLSQQRHASPQTSLSTTLNKVSKGKSFDGEGRNNPSRISSNSKTANIMSPRVSESDAAVNKNQRSHYSNHEHNYYAPEFVHGVPTFLNLFRNVKMTHVSAHPLGSHVLLISNAGLLYSYGNNDFGQLGVGFQSTPTVVSASSSATSTYVMNPMIVTPIVEHGGKAVACAAGVSHSLVVVETEEQRLVRASLQVASYKIDKSEIYNSARKIFNRTKSIENRSRNEQTLSTVTFRHHQLYGFGRNDCLKLGLVNPRFSSPNKTAPPTSSSSRQPHKLSSKKECKQVVDDSGDDDEIEVSVLPRRVALHCSVHPHHHCHRNNADAVIPHEQKNHQQLGIFAIEASVSHSAALVRRSSGNVELYTWGNASNFALGLPMMSISDEMISSSPLSSPPPSNNRQQQENEPQKNVKDSNTTTTTTQGHSSVHIVPVPALVASMSQTSQIHVHQNVPTVLLHHNEYPTKISLGPQCTFVLTSTGRMFSCGKSDTGMLGHGNVVKEVREPSEIKLPCGNDVITSISAGASHVVALSNTGKAYGWGSKAYMGVIVDTSKQQRQDDDSRSSLLDSRQRFEWSPVQLQLYNPDDECLHHSDKSPSGTNQRLIVDACAGYDCTYFVCETGEVYSCGRKSGRLGHGDTSTTSSNAGSTTTIASTLNIPSTTIQTTKNNNIESFKADTSSSSRNSNNDFALVNPLFGGLRLFWRKDPLAATATSSFPRKRGQYQNSNQRRYHPMGSVSYLQQTKLGSKGNNVGNGSGSSSRYLTGSNTGGLIQNEQSNPERSGTDSRTINNYHKSNTTMF